MISRIGYKVFLVDGTIVIPDTMISNDDHSSILSTVEYSDSLFAFWRDFSPAYYCIRSLEDGSEITPVTYLFSESTDYPLIRACPDSLGRLHVLRNIGQDVYYAVWTPAEGSGFIEEYGWTIPEAWIIGMLIVDGDSVHMILDDSSITYMYMQYDLTLIPMSYNDIMPNEPYQCHKEFSTANASYAVFQILDNVQKC